jgi:hypothetical protein
MDTTDWLENFLNQEYSSNIRSTFRHSLYSFLLPFIAKVSIWDILDIMGRISGRTGDPVDPWIQSLNQT